MDAGTFGLCEVCNDPIEQDRLITDPLVRFCLDHLTADEKGLLENDLSLAATIQNALLPPRSLVRAGWSMAYDYEPAGPVSGDYCDILDAEDGRGLLFLCGDVSGKGVAASLLMSQIHAIFRTLPLASLPLARVMEQANRVLCESTIPGYYATLVFGRADESGEVEICNAGHCPPICRQGSRVSTIEATGVPIGLFRDSSYTTTRVRLEPGEDLVLYTDGLSEAEDGAGSEFGTDAVAATVLLHAGAPPRSIVRACVDEMRAFSVPGARADDLTVMALQKS
jgi:sigma-B regulation protein RsbU (phosphoserine phosphatase)